MARGGGEGGGVREKGWGLGKRVTGGSGGGRGCKSRDMGR